MLDVASQITVLHSHAVDLAKKKAAKKKEAAKARQHVKKHDDVNEEGELQDGQVNGAVTNGETNGGVFVKIMPKV